MGRLSDTSVAVAAAAAADATTWATGGTRGTLVALDGPEAAEEEPAEGCHPRDRSGDCCCGECIRRCELRGGDE